PSSVRLGRGPMALRIKESKVTANYFDILGVKPLRGRFLRPSDDNETGDAAAAVISYGFWQRHFAGADSALGAHFTTSDVPFVVVGIAPSGFTGPEVDAADVWAPLGAVATRRFGREWKTRDDLGPVVLVRLGANIPAKAAETEATVLINRVVETEEMASEKRTVVLGSILEARGPSQQTPAVKVSTRLVVASLLVLVAACANLANLLLMRALTRRREMALRLAIGISRIRLASQLLLESLIVALGGSLLAVVAARWGGVALRQLVFPDQQWASSTMDLRVFAFAVLCGTVVALLATIAPAIRMTRADVGQELRSAASRVTQSTGRLRQSLMAVQVALSVLLIVGAAAFSKSLHEAYTFDMGIDVDRLVTIRFSFEKDTLNAATRLAILDEAARRVRGIAGVEQVTVASGLPLGSHIGLRIYIPEREIPKTGTVLWNITPELQSTLGLRLVRGRFLESRDVVPGGVHPVLISEAGAKQLWPGVDPIGRCVQFRPAPPCIPVIGVIRDVRPHSFHQDAGVVTMIGEERPNITNTFQGFVVIRLKSPNVMSSVIGASQRAVLDIRNDLSALEVRPIANALEWEYQPLRLGAYTFSSFAILTIILATIGLYGILAFSVAQRTNEFGIRAALGAQARDLIVSVVREGMIVVGAGVVLGMALSWYASTAIATLLFQSSARDMMPYLYAAVVLTLVALAASIVPARRATRVDPAIALRAE
ncbi:MAG: FtsX-like permease family protein, partial [Gemmatimonas sp.]